VAELRPDERSLGTASPFNIKDRSLTLRDFDEPEVRELLAQHTEETGQRFSAEAQAELFEQTQGQPWLTNALAAQLTTQRAGGKKRVVFGAICHLGHPGAAGAGICRRSMVSKAARSAC
jgi:hypothetical protein